MKRGVEASRASREGDMKSLHRAGNARKRMGEARWCGAWEVGGTGRMDGCVAGRASDDGETTGTAYSPNAPFCPFICPLGLGFTKQRG